MTLRLSVLDQSPIPDGSSAATALANTVDLARRTDALGYTRYWVAEHHSSTALAGAAPEVLIARLADATTNIRVGSGGVMLSHYSALKVAECFRTLHALHRGRIDLGIGRAPGSDQRTARALAHGPGQLGIEHFPAQVADLVAWIESDLAADHPFAGVVAVHDHAARVRSYELLAEACGLTPVSHADDLARS